LEEVMPLQVARRVTAYLDVLQAVIAF